MWFWLIQAIAGSILGNATSGWFEKTKVGKYTQCVKLLVK